jgi:hypothetical protein
MKTFVPFVVLLFPAKQIWGKLLKHHYYLIDKVN